MNKIPRPIAPTTSVESIRLPSVEIPEFHGDYQQWPGFKKLFNEMVHSRTDISDTRKMIYFRQALKGDDAAVLDLLLPGQDDYQLAWQRVDETFDNERILTNAISKKNFGQNYITTPKENVTLDQFFKFTEHRFQALESLSSRGAIPMQAQGNSQKQFQTVYSKSAHLSEMHLL